MVLGSPAEGSDYCLGIEEEHGIESDERPVYSRAMAPHMQLPVVILSGSVGLVNGAEIDGLA